MERIKVSQLLSNPNNPRVIKDDKFKKLVNSIKEFPEMLEARPVVVNPDMIVLGGNMRLKALKEAGVKEVPVYVASWDEIKQKQFIIKDNVGYGEWDWDIIANEWDTEELEEWGLDLPVFDGVDDLGTDFDLPNGEKSPFQQMTFKLADEQHLLIENALAEIKQTQEFKYVETFGNENGNANALYLIFSQWVEQRK